MDQNTATLQILSAMITPSVLISASGLLVLSTSNRLSRVVDRVRVLADLAVKGNAISAAANPEFMLEQLSRLSKRALLLRSALTFLYLSISMFVITSISVGIVVALQWQYGWIPVACGLTGSLTLLYGSLLLISEGRHAIASTLQEMNLVRDIITRKQD